MKKTEKQLPIAFLLCTLYAFVLPVLIPQLRLTYYAPFLILLFYRANLATNLWIALLIGLLIDLFATDTRFGLNAISYCLTVWTLYQRKRMFFEDNKTTLPCMTILFGLVLTLFQTALLFAFNKKLPLSMDWIGANLVAMPLLDGLYAWLAILIPLSLLQRKFWARTR